MQAPGWPSILHSESKLPPVGHGFAVPVAGYASLGTTLKIARWIIGVDD